VTALVRLPSSPLVGGLRSAVYEGMLRHRRYGPGPGHDFSYAVAMPLLDLAEIDAVAALHPLWSGHRPAPIWFRRADFLGPSTVPLDEAVRDLVEQRTGHRPVGSVALLANLRRWGWLFNPLSLYFCTDGNGAVEALVAEVENTPWHERCTYVVGGPGRHRFAKTMHVSPFLPTDEVDYELRYSAPADGLVVRLDVLRGDERLLGVTLSLRRRTLDRHQLGRLVWSRPASTHLVSARIYTQAARLKLAGAPFHRRRASPPARP
jgi:uncharacterized protein